VSTLGGPNPGLGYNGRENHIIAHQDRAILGHRQIGPGVGYQFGGSGGGLGYRPDSYYNNQIDPIYRRPIYSPNLLTTGPNRYYQGKNPIGVYERYHRLGWIFLSHVHIHIILQLFCLVLSARTMSPLSITNQYI
jgi:hypothetical protein